MKLPINFLLYVISVGLLGLAGYTFYKALPRGSGPALKASGDRGYKEAGERLTKGRGEGPVTASWNYASAWWRQAFLGANLINKPPEIPQGPTTPTIEEKPKPVHRPIADLIEIQALVYDGSAEGKGGDSHVIVRYKEGVEVRPPVWYQRENQPPPPPGAGGPGDAVANPGGRPRGGGSVQRPVSPMPMSSAGAEVVQKVWVAGDGSPRFEATLWPPHDDVRLVLVKPHAKSAVFVRELRSGDGATEAEQPKPEEIFKNSQFLSQELMASLVSLDRAGDANLLRQQQQGGGSQGAAGSRWIEVEETRKIEDTVHIARAENPDRLLELVSFDSYVSKTGSGLRGVVVTTVAPDVGRRFGVAQGDVLLAVNNEPVSTRAEAINVGKKQYNRGTRTFVLKFLTASGTEVERTYQAPDK